jgi:hypothetical protein
MTVSRQPVIDAIFTRWRNHGSAASQGTDRAPRMVKRSRA